VTRYAVNAQRPAGQTCHIPEPPDSSPCGILSRHGPCLVRSEAVPVEPREFLAVTASFDHDIVDGAPAARFARRLREIVEGAEVLRDRPRVTPSMDVHPS